MRVERRDITTRSALVRRIVEGVVQNPSITLSVDTLQQSLGVRLDVARRLLDRLASSEVLREVQSGIWTRDADLDT